MRLQAILVIVTVCVGCSQEQVLTKVSARLVGCPPQDVVIGDVHREGTRPRRWTVACQSRAWECGNTGGRVTCRSGTRACRDSWGQLICQDAAATPSDRGDMPPDGMGQR